MHFRLRESAYKKEALLESITDKCPSLRVRLAIVFFVPEANFASNLRKTRFFLRLRAQESYSKCVC